MSVAYHVGVEWAAGSYTEIRDDVLHAVINREMATIFTAITPGELTLEVLNVQGKYHPDNSASPFFGFINPGKKVRVRAVYELVEGDFWDPDFWDPDFWDPDFWSGAEVLSYQLFQGYLDEVALTGNDVQNGRAILRCRDLTRELKHRTINTSLYADWNVASLFSVVFSSSGVSSYIVDSIADTARLGWFKDLAAEEAIQELLKLGFYRAWVDGSGVFRVKNRYYDQGIATTASYANFLSLDYARTDDSVVNDVTLESAARLVSTDASTLSYIVNQISVPASSSVAFVMEYLDPITKRPVPATEMEFLVGSDHAVSTDPVVANGALTSSTVPSVQFYGETVVCTVFNGTATDGYLTKFQVRGKHLPEVPKIGTRTEQSSSQSVFGRRSFFFSSDLLGQRSYLADYEIFLLDRFLDPMPSVTCAVRNQYPSMLGLDVGARVHISNVDLRVHSSHIITGLEHDIALAGGLVHTTTARLERLKLYSLFTVDDSDLGELDSGNILAF